MADPVTPRAASQPAVGSRTVTRRQVLGGIAGVAGLAAAPSLIAACSTPAASSAGTSAAPSAAGSAPASAAVTGSTTLGSNYSNTDTDTKAMQATVDAFTKKTSIAVKVNTTNHEDFQTRISSYLQGTPDDVFTWFAGYRMRTYANQGLAGDLTELWG